MILKYLEKWRKEKENKFFLTSRKLLAKSSDNARLEMITLYQNIGNRYEQTGSDKVEELTPEHLSK